METLLLGIADGILTITINRPDKLNALNAQVLSNLDTILQDVYQEKNIHGVIITGSGEKAFVAGADISEFSQLNADEAYRLARKGQDIFSTIERSPKPIIAAVNGFALGGGCELALACHIRIASSNAKFGQPEVNLGLIPGYGGTQRLPHLVGKGKAMEIILSGNMVDATEAHRIGLINHITTPEELIPYTTSLLKTILSKSPSAVSKCIAAINAVYDPATTGGFESEARLFSECAGSEEMKEGVSAFLEKRKPVFRK